MPLAPWPFLITYNVFHSNAFVVCQAHIQLSPLSRFGSGTELDCYLDAIVRSSMAVANICEGMRREKIVQACQKVSVMLGKQISSANKPSSKILVTNWHKLNFIWALSAFTWHKRF